MPILLAERAVKAVLGTLQSRLNDELSRIDVGHQDGIQLDPIAEWHGFSRPDAAFPSTSGVWVSRGRVTFPTWDRDANAYASCGSAVLISSCPVVIEVVWANRRMRSRGDFELLAMRYEAAIARVLLHASDLDQGDTAHVRIDAIESEPAAGGTEGRSWGHSRAGLTVELAEDASGEGVAGGEVAPAAEMDLTR
jgi:hypothetical protein